MTGTTAVQEAAVITIQTKSRSRAAKKEFAERWKQTQIQQLNLLALFFVKKENGSPENLKAPTAMTKHYSRVSLAAACTVQRWYRCVQRKKRVQQRAHLERVQTIKSRSANDVKSCHRADEVWKQLLLAVVCIILLGFNVKHSPPPASNTTSVDQHVVLEINKSCEEAAPFHEVIVNSETTTVADVIPRNGTTKMNLNTSVYNESTLHIEKMCGAAFDLMNSSTMNVANENDDSSSQQQDTSTRTEPKVERTMREALDALSNDDGNESTKPVGKKRKARMSKSIVAQVISTSSTNGAKIKGIIKSNKAIDFAKDAPSNENVKSPQVSSEMLALAKALLIKNGSTVKLESREVFLACAEELANYTGLLYCMRQ